MSDKPRKPCRKCFGSILFFVCFVAACTLLALEATEPFSKPDSCTMCHEMQPVFDRWSKSSHFANASGVKVECIECHLPPREDTIGHVWGKISKGAAHGWVHFFGEFDENHSRQLVQNTIPDSRCTHCHSNLTAKPSTPAVGAVHAMSLKRTGVSRDYACVVCHNYMHSPKPPAPEPKYYDEEADNSFCYVCHLNFQKEPFVLQHKRANIACYDCHGESMPHADDEDNSTAPQIMFTKQMVNDSCGKSGCHSDKKMRSVTSHKAWYAESDRYAVSKKTGRAVTKPSTRPTSQPSTQPFVDPNDPREKQYCTDCHGMHRIDERQRIWHKKTGKLIWRDGHYVDPNEQPKPKPIGEESM